MPHEVTAHLSRRRSTRHWPITSAPFSCWPASRSGFRSCRRNRRVFLRDHHEGYIDWTTFEDHQRLIERNNFRGESDATAGAARAGKGLLTGLLRCGRCGRKLQVRYWGKAGTSARDVCAGDFVAAGGRYCVAFGGATVDRRFADELLRVLSPLGMGASLEAIDRGRTLEQDI